MLIRKSKVLGLALNLMENCFACDYCWNIEQRKRAGQQILNHGFDTNTVELLTQLEKGAVPKPEPPSKCQFYLNEGHDILLGAKAEFFCDFDLSMRIIHLLEMYPDISDRCRILTKQNIAHLLKYIPQDMMIGTTITTLDEDIARSIEHGAASVKQRVMMLRLANDAGFKTWVVVEPFFKGMRLSDIIEDLAFVNEMWVGRLNSGKGNTIQEGKYRGLTCGDLAMDDTDILKDLKSNLEWLKQETRISVAYKKPLNIAKVTWESEHPDFNIYPKREVFRLMGKAGLLHLLPEHVVDSARAGKHA